MHQCGRSEKFFSTRHRKIFEYYYHERNRQETGNPLSPHTTIKAQSDTSARLKEYLGYFDINAVGLTGTKTQIDKVVHAYNAYYQKVPTKSALGYFINHTNIVYLIDKQGKVRYLFHQDDSSEKMAKVIKETTITDT